jgi:uncharacterized protein (DUF427 family)
MSKEAAQETYEGYRVVVRPSDQQIRAVANGETVADSRHVLVMSETHLPDVYYFPRADVRTDLLTPTTLVTNCPFKGNANYWSLNVSDTLIANVAWSYEDVFDETRIIKDYLAFD